MHSVPLNSNWISEVSIANCRLPVSFFFRAKYILSKNNLDSPISDNRKNVTKPKI